MLKEELKRLMLIKRIFSARWLRPDYSDINQIAKMKTKQESDLHKK